MELALTFGGQRINVPTDVPEGGFTNLQIYISNTLTIFILAGIFLMVIYIVWAGLGWITSSGDKQKLASARGRLTWAIIGLIIILSATGIINLIGYFFQINLLKPL
ncbi:MAG TPA: hypothetical protein VLF20_06345 [Patescibacteria group bacterium]|nr:hypothetical protein [Patescibacteria group bacterium]